MWVCVGSFFMFSNFYQLDLHNEAYVAIANQQLKRQQYLD